MRSLVPLVGVALFACDLGMDVPEADVQQVYDTVRPQGTQLLRFRSCNDLQAHLVDVAVESLVQSRYSGYYWGPMTGGVDDMADAGSPGSEGPSDWSQTNTQEVGVDEVDLVKTDGLFLYTVVDGSFNVLRSWPAEDTALLSSTSLDGYPTGLFLYGDQVVVFSQVYGTPEFEFRGWYGTQVTVFDVTDRAHPTVDRTLTLEGGYADARLIDSSLYLVVNSYQPMPYELWDVLWDPDVDLPEVAWDAPEQEQELVRDIARDLLRPTVAQVIDDVGIDAFLPRIQDTAPGTPITEPHLLHECEDLYQPPEMSQHSVLSLVQLDLDTGQLGATGILADGWTVYASRDRLYVAQPSWWWWWGWGDLDMTTAIHAFDLRGGEPQYVASGEVSGWLLDQFSMSEHQGVLRVASTVIDWWWGMGTSEEQEGARITVLQPQGGELVEIGVVEGIAPGERITAVRMMGPEGFIVTFEQIDPLFTVDLSNPRSPRVVGELELPGFSSYLHPLGDGHLLAVGRSGDWNGAITGLAVSVFDVTDMADPQLAHQFTLEDNGWSSSEALWDHHAFTYHRGVLSIPVYLSSWDADTQTYDRFSGLVVLQADADGIVELGRVDHLDLVEDSVCIYSYGCEYAWWSQVRRSVYIEDNLLSLSDYGVKVNDLYAPDTEIARVLFRPLP